jgi:hypothetical protein
VVPFEPPKIVLYLMPLDTTVEGDKLACVGGVQRGNILVDALLSQHFGAAKAVWNAEPWKPGVGTKRKG